MKQSLLRPIEAWRISRNKSKLFFSRHQLIITSLQLVKRDPTWNHKVMLATRICLLNLRRHHS